jgi:uncharacterized protein YejL (UPF0352 family)
MRRQEVAHYTRAQVCEHLADALAVVDEAKVPDDLRPVALQEVVRLLAAKQIVMEQFQPPMLTPSGARL